MNHGCIIDEMLAVNLYNIQMVTGCNKNVKDLLR